MITKLHCSQRRVKNFEKNHSHSVLIMLATKDIITTKQNLTFTSQIAILHFIGKALTLDLLCNFACFF